MMVLSCEFRAPLSFKVSENGMLCLTARSVVSFVSVLARIAASILVYDIARNPVISLLAAVAHVLWSCRPVPHQR